MTTSKPLPDLKIRLKRRPDDSAAITCVREDGSVTWQRQEGSVGQVFPAQDLTHYSVETTFGYLYVATRGDRASLPELTDESLNRVKEFRAEVFTKWAATAPGETLELLFQRAVNHP